MWINRAAQCVAWMDLFAVVCHACCCFGSSVRVTARFLQPSADLDRGKLTGLFFSFLLPPGERSCYLRRFFHSRRSRCRIQTFVFFLFLRWILRHLCAVDSHSFPFYFGACALFLFSCDFIPWFGCCYACCSLAIQLENLLVCSFAIDSNLSFPIFLKTCLHFFYFISLSAIF